MLEEIRFGLQVPRFAALLERCEPSEELVVLHLECADGSVVLLHHLQAGQVDCGPGHELLKPANARISIVRCFDINADVPSPPVRFAMQRLWSELHMPTVHHFEVRAVHIPPPPDECQPPMHELARHPQSLQGEAAWVEVEDDDTEHIRGKL